MALDLLRALRILEHDLFQGSISVLSEDTNPIIQFLFYIDYSAGEAEDSDPAPVDLSQEEVDSVYASGIHETKISQKELDAYDVCAICLEEYQMVGETVASVNTCNHSFHIECMTGSIRAGQKCCPLCRRLFGPKQGKKRGRDE